MVDYARRNKKEWFLFKVDFEKAYVVCLGTILNTLWSEWDSDVYSWSIWMCMFSNSMSILVNDIPTMDFQSKGGLR